MRFDTSQHMRMGQQQKLAPRMIQSMEILALSSQALEERIEAELTSNPTLEIAEPGTIDTASMQAESEQVQRDDKEGERSLDIEGEKAKNADDFERLSNISEEYGESWDNTYEGAGYRVARDRGERDVKLEAMANTAGRPQSLAEQLLEQWVLMETEPAIRAAGEYLIGYIDNDGYLRIEKHTLLSKMPLEMTESDLDEALELIQQSIEPPGIGARDLRECLLLQIDAAANDLREEHADQDRFEDLLLATVLVRDHLKDIEMNRLPKIAKALGRSIDEVKTAIAKLRQFHPHPGRMLVDDSPQRIRPDAIVEYDEVADCYFARLANDRLPALQLSARYEKMAKDKGVDKRARDFVGNNLRSAHWLMDAIRQRQSTMLRVIHVVLDAQRDYFDLGPQHLKPLPMTQVADQLGIHVGTVSRAVSEKYLQTPRGIVPLRSFFSGGTENAEGEAMSWVAVQAKLEEIIDQEDKSAPYNDDQLVEKLKGEGIQIARRTVAKYRKQLDIPPARQRREY